MEEKTPDQICRELVKALKKVKWDYSERTAVARCIHRELLDGSYLKLTKDTRRQKVLGAHDEKYKIDKP